MHRSVLADKGFIRFSDEALVLLMAHNELGHAEARETDVEGNEVRRCSLYPGLACRDHLDAAVDIDTARADDLVKVPFLELCPNTWLVAPTGVVTQVTEEEQFDPAKVRERVEALQKELGKALPLKALPELVSLLEKAEANLDEKKWREGLGGLAALAAMAKEPHASLKALITGHFDEAEEDVRFDFEDLRDDKKLAAPAKRERIAALLASIDVKVLGAHLPVRAAMETWLAAHGPAAR